MRRLTAAVMIVAVVVVVTVLQLHNASGQTAATKPARVAGGANLPLGSANYVPSPERPVGWRGDGTGRFPGATPPTLWERARNGAGYSTKGIVWAAMLPNRGVSSPIVAGDRVFVTCDYADLVCLDKQTGRILWIRSNLECETLTDEQRQAMPDVATQLDPLVVQLSQANAAVVDALNAQLPSASTAAYRVPAALEAKRKLDKQIHKLQQDIDKNFFKGDWPQDVYGFCTETPASDGKHVYAYFASGVSVCYDFDGKRKWIARGTNGGEEKGNFTSPLLIGGQFVVWGGPEMRSYAADTGKLLWTAPAKGANASSLYRVQAGKELVAGWRNYFVRISDGQPIWGSGNIDNGVITPIVEGDTICTWASGNPGGLKAFKVPAGTEGGKLTSALSYKTEWPQGGLGGKFEQGVMGSPLLVDGLIYYICSGGGLAVNDANTGQMAYSKILPMKPHTEYWAWGGAAASPALAGKHIYLIDNQGTTVVIQPGREYKEVSVNRIEDSTDGRSQTQNLACPFFDGARLYYRTPAHLYCIGER